VECDHACGLGHPKDWDIVGGSGHQAAWLAQQRGRPAERLTTVREFGAVGNGLS
jgi:acetolactate synthase I/II/III large subunit